jgi:hypothetical protein
MKNNRQFHTFTSGATYDYTGIPDSWTFSPPTLHTATPHSVKIRKAVARRVNGEPQIVYALKRYKVYRNTQLMTEFFYPYGKVCGITVCAIDQKKEKDEN